ncbi:MAG: hypothetical protein U9R37_07980 [Campylobacterota bacterium]|nr:hypothetical protein [Campylobacterota bacterium]
MEKLIINKFVSNTRFNSYDGIELYKKNLLKSKELYIPLSILEVSLRNSINTLFEKLYGAGWLVNEANFLKHKELEKIYNAKNKLKSNKEQVTKDKLVAELNFGFWTGLFQSLYQEKMRLNNLKQIFINLPSKDMLVVDRKLISSKLNHIREFRNRVFHHENILKVKYKDIEKDIFEILMFLDEKIYNFTKNLNNESIDDL